VPHGLAPAMRVPTPVELRSQDNHEPLTVGYTPDHMPVVIWPRSDAPVLEVGCVQIRLVRLTERLRAGLAECLERAPAPRPDP
jgi:hypothetical protein